MDALIGYTGFVGSHLIDENMDVYNSKNIREIIGKTYKNIYCAGIYAEKWKANLDPESDRLNIQTLMDYIATVRCDKFILISTVDVYNAGFPQSEDPDCCPNIYATHPYGKNRYDFEEWVKNTFSKTYIFRLPALFGHGLKKNALYDLIHKNQIEKIRSQWIFQWYDLKWLKNDIEFHVNKNHTLVNLVTPPISIKLIQTLFFPETQLSTDDSNIKYKIMSKYGYSHSQEDVLVAMALFIRSKESNLLVSELAFPFQQMKMFDAYLCANGVSQREIVPSKRNWDMNEYSNVYSAQSILYGVDIQIFQEPERFLTILRDRLTRLHSVGTTRIVFGSPKQRMYSGEDAISLFQKVGDMCREYDIVMCVENNARHYGGNWLYTLKDTIEFVESVNHSHIGVNLDTGSMILENETIVPSTNRIAHIQVSFPNLSAWDDSYVPFIRNVLSQISAYRGKISLEMNTPSLSSIESFLKELSPSQIFQ